MDVHKSFLVACIASINEQGVTTYKGKRFCTFTGDLRRCATWLGENNCKDVCMEPTGMYWLPIYNILEHARNIVLAHPKYVKAIRGKKTDKKDAKWFADIFKAGDLKRVIVFSGSKFKVKQLAASLQQIGVNCGAMHSDLEQAERDDVMFKFKSGQYDVLVATDIVARGIDIDDIEMVINYDVPHDTEDYVHRIGRTARANRDGRAITFVSEEDQYWFQQIEKFLEKVVDKMPLPEGCGEGPEYIKINKPKKKGANGRNNRRGNGKNGEAGKNSAKNRRQKDRDQTSHKRKPNKPNERQEKAPRSNEQQPQQGNKQQNAKQQPQQGNKQQNAKQQNRKPAQPGEQPKNSNSQKRRNNSNNSNQQRPGTENNVRPGSTGRGRGVAQKKGDKPAAHKHTPIVNPQKKENAVKKFIKRIFGFKK